MFKYTISAVCFEIGVLIARAKRVTHCSETKLLFYGHNGGWSVLYHISCSDLVSFNCLIITCLIENPCSQCNWLDVRTAGKRGRGRPARTWEKDIEEWAGTNIGEATRMAERRDLWCTVIDVTAAQP